MNSFEPNNGNDEISRQWEEAGIYKASNNVDDKKKNYYVLDMFPYPSGDGLHVGHVESYTGSDIIARYMRAKGYNVLHPVGWDAFGLPAENYAIKKGMPPQQTTKINIENFTRQIKSLGFSYDWSREINTSDPSYYKWTQWIFLKLYEKGLAYKKKAKANWCESCQTVLANEQVVDGACERCGSEVIQKNMEQWFFKITDYADRLLKDLDGLDWPENIKEMQRNWIGRSEGAEIKFSVKGADDELSVFTTRPDTLYGITYMVLAPEHPLVNKITTPENKEDVEGYKRNAATKSQLQRTDLALEKTGVFTGGYAIHPATGKELPIWVADYVIEEYGGGAVMAVPAHDQRDFEFAKKYQLPIVEVVSPESGNHDLSVSAYTSKGLLVNSEDFNGISSEDAKKKIVEKVGAKWKVTYRLRDWLVSRQRYWGAPIPIIYCDNCGIVPVPEKDLPVKLPGDVDFRPTGESPLERSESFHDVQCPKCGGSARRESDTMDTFVCSSWYFLRYLDPNNSEKAFTDADVKKWMPVDVYIGGAEHAVLHLLYARFFTKFLSDHGYLKMDTHVDEPFTKLRNQGIILGPDNQKMSKSRGNVINPDEISESYGADALRLYEMFLGPFDQPKAWNTQGIEGVFRFIKRLFSFYESAGPVRGNEYLPETKLLVEKISAKIEKQMYNTAISDFMTHLNFLPSTKYSRSDLEVFAVLLSPFAPFTSEKLWKILGKKDLACQQSWPNIGVAKEAENIFYAIQIDGKTRGDMVVNADYSKEQIIQSAKDVEGISKRLEGKQITKEIVVPKRLVNFVTK